MGDVIELKPAPKPRARRKSPTKAELQEELRLLRQRVSKAASRARKPPAPDAPATAPGPGTDDSRTAGALGTDVPQTSAAALPDGARTAGAKMPVASGVSVTAVTPLPLPPAHHEHLTPLALLTALAYGTAAGAYQVLLTVLWPMYGAGAILRALVPLGLEAIAGTVAHRMVAGPTRLHWLLRLPVALAAAVVIGYSARTELDAAAAAPAVAERERVALVLAQATQAAHGEVQLKDAPPTAGKRGTLAFERSQAAALALQAKRDADARELREQRLANARQTSSQESRLPTELAILGAIGSSCALPLLEAFLGVLRRRRQARS